MKLLKILTLSLGLTFSAFAADIVEVLPAGGVYVFQAKDKYTIKCSTDPIVPTIVAKSCGCFQRWGQVSSTWSTINELRLTVFLSNGNQSQQVITTAVSMQECEKKITDQYADLCVSN